MNGPTRMKAKFVAATFRFKEAPPPPAGAPAGTSASTSGENK
jgi:hypothetical protein